MHLTKGAEGQLCVLTANSFMEAKQWLSQTRSQAQSSQANKVVSATLRYIYASFSHKPLVLSPQ